MEKVPTREDQAELEQSEGSTKETRIPADEAEEAVRHIHAKTLILLAVSSRAKPDAPACRAQTDGNPA